MSQEVKVVGHLQICLIFAEISARHIEGKKLDKTVWNLLNFYALVKYHVKVTLD